MNTFLSIICIGILVPLAIAGYSMAPWVPTRKKDIQRLISLIDLKKWESFFEIWCGDGRVSYAIAKAFPKSQIVGLELAYPVFILAYLRKILWTTSNYHVVLWDAFKRDISHFDHIYVYGMPDKMAKKIVPKFMSEAKQWAKLYSYVFSIPEEYQQDVVSHGSEEEAKIHVLEKK